MRLGVVLWWSWGFSIAGGRAETTTWLTVHDGNAERVAVDLARVETSANGVAAWSRIDLGRLVGEAADGYDNIQALNAYDCAARRFITLRRAYFRGDTLVRELPPPRRQRNVVAIGSLEEKVFNVACRQPDARSRLTPALATADTAARILPVADPLATDRPRLIVLPPIDKAAADRAAAEVAEKKAATRGTSAEPDKPAGAAVKAADKMTDKAISQAAAKSSAAGGRSAVSPAPTSSRSAMPAAGKTSDKASDMATNEAANVGIRRGGVVNPPPMATRDTANERRLRELYYATSGPRRATATKSVAGHPPRAAEPWLSGDDWTYAGERGPAHWARLSRDYALCGEGKRQSPIDIRDGIKVDLEAIGFDYKPSHFSILDTGRTIRVNPAENMGLTLTGKRYRLTEFHFHQPAEEVVEGRGYDMAIHLVHRADDGSPLIVTLLLMRGDAEQPLIQTLWNNLPLDRGLVVAPEDTIDLNALLPRDRRYWTYIGSLTEPPCSEGVIWLVLKQPVAVSAAQMAIFSRLYPRNARPVQPGNGRLIKESR